MSIPLLPPNDVPSNSSPSASITTTSSSSVPFDVISPSSTNGGGTPILPPFPAFSTPAPIPAGGGGGGGDGSNNGGGLPSAGPNIASSASLYLYTFLATLVLLLGVSASIVVRSLILRRRHRRMMEEAIRNGTWIPPAPTIGGHTGRVKVDLSKKPKMFEVWLGGGIIGPGVNSYGTAPPSLGVGAGGYRQYDVGTGTGLGKKTHRTTHSAHHGYTQDWESIHPFSAAYISPPTSSTSNSNVNALSSDLGGTSLPIGTSPDRGPGSPSGGVGGGGRSEISAFLGISSWSMPSMPSPGIWAGRILRRIRRPGSSMEQQQQQQQQQQMVMATTTSHGGITNGGLVDMDSKSGGGRPYVQTMRVAVMIAMPSPSTSTLLSSMRSHSHPTATGSHPLASPPTTAPSSSSSSSSSPSQTQLQSHSQTQSHNAHNAPLHEYNYEYEAEDDQPLPHIEFGIADVPIVVVEEGQRGRHSDDDDQGSSTLDGKVGRRRSFGFGGSEGGHGRGHDHDNEQGLILEDVEMEEMDVGEMRRRV